MAIPLEDAEIIYLDRGRLSERKSAEDAPNFTNLSYIAFKKSDFTFLLLNTTP
jgi:hypothetical protein